MLYVLIKFDKCWRATEKDWRIFSTRNASLRTKNNKTQQIKNVLNVLLIWLWFQKRYSTRLLLNSIHMNYILLKKKKSIIIDTDLHDSYMYSFWKRNNILKNSETRWAANACRRSNLHVYMDHWKFNWFMAVKHVFATWIKFVTWI